MTLLTPEILDRLPSFKEYSKNTNPDPIVHAKLFTPDANWTWFIIAFDSESQHCFGLFVIRLDAKPGKASLDAHFADFSLTDLKGIRGPLGLGVERDRFFRPSPVSEALAEALCATVSDLN